MLNINIVGKTLAIINLGLSLLFITWSYALFVERPAHKEQTTKTGKVPPLTTVLGDKIKAALAERDVATARWQTETTAVADLEAQQVTANVWYAEQLRIMETGVDNKNQEIATPVRALVYDKGQLKLDGKGLLPALGDPIPETTDQPLKSYAAYVLGLDRAWTDIAKERAEITQLVKQNQELTEKINGDKGKPGLRDVLAAEEIRQRHALDEQQYLDPLVYNRLVEVDLLTKRKLALEARKSELQKAPGTPAKSAARP
jgi:hypothetical protein